MRGIPLRRALPLALAALLLGPTACFHYSNVERDDERHPVMNTGVGGTILYPGQRPPALPAPPGATSASQSSGPATSGSTRSSGAGPGSPAGTVPDASSSVSPVLIGGTETDLERKRREHHEPHWANPFWTPFAVVLYPYRKIRDALRRDPEPPAASAPPDPAPAATRQDLQAAHERARLEALERQLAEQRGASPGPLAPPDPAPGAAPAGSAGTLSIAEELAALRQARARGGAPAPLPAPGPAPAPHAGQPVGPPADRVEDRNGDGRPDFWSHREDGLRVREVFDDDGDGRPDRSVFYDPHSGQRIRVEEDANGDGRPDAWSYYASDRLVRRRLDHDGDGVVDAWSFYRDEQIVRHEQDTDGDGFRDRIEFYANGKLARREEDRDANGRPDRITRFDASGAPLDREEDSDGDGRIDVRSYFAEGRLVRRELLTDFATREADGLSGGEAAPAPDGPPTSALP